MKLLELMARLCLWPFDTPPEGDDADVVPGCCGQLIVVPKSMQQEVQPARWPSEYERRTRH
jgi:hypothetical protein